MFGGQAYSNKKSPIIADSGIVDFVNLHTFLEQRIDDRKMACEAVPYAVLESRSRASGCNKTHRLIWSWQTSKEDHSENDRGLKKHKGNDPFHIKNLLVKSRKGKEKETMVTG